MKKILLSCLMVLTCINQAFAWQVQLEDSTHMPESIVVIDKGAQSLSYLEKHSPLSTLYSYPSIHGELEGDKELEGDLRTPEGIYFITTKIRMPLDFEKYGSQAHALNYPNPVDRLRGKTGSGIWIHSKGNPIESQKTQGCIAIDLNDIAELEPLLKAGTPVMVAQTVLTPNLNSSNANKITDAYPSNQPLISVISDNVTPANTPSGNATLENTVSDNTALINTGSDQATLPNNVVSNAEIQSKLVKLTQEWNNAWASRSDSFFDFYDTVSYSKAQREPFSKFKRQKNNLFDNMNWIYISHEDVNVLQGPGYWVTWFKQYYRAPNHRTEGIRRLYWQLSENGEYQIVGMEWLSRYLKFEKKFRRHALNSIPSFIDAWQSTWKSADSENYATFYSPTARQDSIQTIDEIVSRKNSIWKLKKPTQIEFSNMIIDVRNDAIYVKMDQKYSDSSGYRDNGVKTLVLYPYGSSWLIANEQWSRR